MAKRTRRAQKGDPLLGVAYIRVSTDEQKLGPEAQRADVEAWSLRTGVRVVAWHADHGLSGADVLEDRPGLVAALGELRAAGAGLLVVAKRDRLARDVGIACAVERAAEACGACVVSADGSGNGEDAASVFMRRVLDAAAEYERALIRARTKGALRAKRAKGERVGSVRYGYQLAGDRVTLVEDAGEQAVIARARALAAEGMSLREVTARITEEGLRGRVGPLALTQVARIVSGKERKL